MFFVEVLLGKQPNRALSDEEFFKQFRQKMQIKLPRQVEATQSSLVQVKNSISYHHFFIGLVWVGNT